MTNLSLQQDYQQFKPTNTFLKIISEICSQQNITLIPYDNHNILELVKGDMHRFIWRRKFDLNNATALRLADNKYECSLVLQKKGIPTLKYDKLITEFSAGHYQLSTKSVYSIKGAFDDNALHVLKPNAGYEGGDVFLCRNFYDVDRALMNFHFPHKSLVISPYYPATCEYRIIVLDGEQLLVYRKNLPYIIGDGKSSLAELMLASGKDSVLMESTKDQHRIIPDDEKVYLGWQHNLSKGATSEIVYDDCLVERLSEIAKAAAHAINIRFASVDILELDGGQFKIIEINSGVVVEKFVAQHPEGYAIAKQLYGMAVNKMFGLR